MSRRALLVLGISVAPLEGEMRRPIEHLEVESLGDLRLVACVDHRFERQAPDREREVRIDDRCWVDAKVRLLVVEARGLSGCSLPVAAELIVESVGRRARENARAAVGWNAFKP